MKKEYISLSVDSKSQDSSFLSFSSRRRRPVWRWWNQLSRFQRSLLYLIVLLGVLLLLYWWSADHGQNSRRQLPIQDLFAAEETTTKTVVQVLPDIGHPPSVNPFVVQDAQPAPEIPEQIEHVNNIENPEEVENVLAEVDVAGHNGDNAVVDQPATVKPIVPFIKPTPMKFTGPTTERQKSVVDAFRHAWQGYKQFAWGHDNLKPISTSFHDWFGLGLTIVDSLDTMYIMGLKNEYEDARNWVAKDLKMDINRDVNLFEVTIRVLGGLLSAFHLSGDQLFLEKAVDLGDRLLPCFESDSGVPFSDINLSTLKAHSPKWSPDSSTSEVTTIQLEFRDLSRCTGDSRYEDAAARVSMHIHQLPKTDGLVPIFINAQTGQFRTYSTITLGARGDSYYEYLLKQWIQTGQTIDYLKADYLQAMTGMEKHLAKRTPKQNLLFIGELMNGGKDFKPKMDHLTCYLPGTMALGVHFGMPQKHMDFAADLLGTCYRTYTEQPTGLAAEITYFNIQESANGDMYVKTNDAHNLLRPETVESLWYMYQLTGNTTYQDWGWEIFQAFEKHTKVTNGYTTIGNVKSPLQRRPKDMMESFFLGETLKYFYLLFSDDRSLLSLDHFVLNSEAHPLPIFES